MKKVYITPSLEVIGIDTVEIMAGSPPQIEIDKDGEVGDEQLSNDRRGSWGNLWNE